MKPVEREAVLAAADRIRGWVRRTPVLAADSVWFKCEFLQHSGSFKARGAFNRQMAARERGELEGGVVVASGGNAGLAHAYAAARLGVPATVFVPETAPAVKLARLRGYGARVVQVGTEYAQAYEAAVQHAADGSALLCHAYDQPDIVAGAGALGLELLEDVPDVGTVIVSAGGGGLYAGVAAAVEDRARVVIVEPQTCPTVSAARKAGAPVDVAVSGVAADSLGARRIGDLAWASVVRWQPESVLVSDEAIVRARTRLWSQLRIAAEPGAAAAYAALDEGAYVPAPGERVAVVVCGANTDPSTLVDAFETPDSGSGRTE